MSDRSIRWAVQQDVADQVARAGSGERRAPRGNPSIRVAGVGSSISRACSWHEVQIGRFCFFPVRLFIGRSILRIAQPTNMQCGLVEVQASWRQVCPSPGIIELGLAYFILTGPGFRAEFRIAHIHLREVGPGKIGSPDYGSFERYILDVCILKSRPRENAGTERRPSQMGAIERRIVNGCRIKARRCEVCPRKVRVSDFRINEPGARHLRRLEVRRYIKAIESGLGEIEVQVDQARRENRPDPARGEVHVDHETICTGAIFGSNGPKIVFKYFIPESGGGREVDMIIDPRAWLPEAEIDHRKACAGVSQKTGCPGSLRCSRLRVLKKIPGRDEDLISPVVQIKQDGECRDKKHYANEKPGYRRPLCLIKSFHDAVINAQNRAGGHPPPFGMGGRGFFDRICETRRRRRTSQRALFDRWMAGIRSLHTGSQKTFNNRFIKPERAGRCKRSRSRIAGSRIRVRDRRDGEVAA
jgi:hypothetical protein